VQRTLYTELSDGAPAEVVEIVRPPTCACR